MKTLQLNTNQVIWISRHGNCINAENDIDRVLSQQGISDSSIVGQKLRNAGFGVTLNEKSGFNQHIVEIISPAKRVIQTAELLNVHPTVQLVYDDLYNFEQFPHMEEVYSNGSTDPNAYFSADKETVTIFQNKFSKNLAENNFMDVNFLSIVSHAIISNFIAMMFTDDQMVYDTMLPESAGFLITKDSCQLITA